MPDEEPPQVELRERYKHFLAIPTRWMDNDVYGHVNNVVYYSYFDTVINAYLIERGVLDVAGGEVIGLAVETGCQFKRSLTFPEVIDAGLRVGRLGSSSVRYEVGLFRQSEAEVAAHGFFIHVFVDRATRRPTPIAGALRDALMALTV
jgi:acyl-CoA thioester hydrolase